MILGHGWIGLSRILPPEPPLCRLVGQFHLHRPWIAHRLDPARLATVQRMAGRRITRIAPVLWLLPALIPLLAAAPAAGAILYGVSVWLRHYIRPILLAGAVAIGLAAALVPPRHPSPAVPPRPNIPALVQHAEAGDGEAAYLLGLRYAQGDAVPRDPVAAAGWFRRAVPSEPRAAVWLRYFYETGQGVAADPVAARLLYLNGAERGNATAQADYAVMLNFGRGGPMDLPGAFQWYLRAAAQGELRGLNGVGYSYLVGRGVPADPARAVPWLRAAAEAGQPNAMHTLGTLYLEGNVIAAAPKQAYYWLALALRIYPPTDEKRPAAEALLQRAAAFLSPDDRVMLAEDVKDWRAEPPQAPEKISLPPLSPPPTERGQAL
jgi:TPR repeat protein